ncbi:hypothetical protein KJ966_12030 [bacterium]|nr:hypothetical protein [bacterium]
MNFQRFFLNLIEWFIPDHAKKDIDKRIKAQLTTTMLIIVIPFHIGPIIKFLALNSPAVYVNFAHIIVCIILLILMKLTGRTSLLASLLIITLFLQEATSVYFTGGLTSNVMGLILVIPMGGIILIGYRSGIFFLLLLIGFIWMQNYLIQIGHVFPAYNVTTSALFKEKYYYAIAVLIAYSLIAMVFQVIKNNSVRSQREVQERSQLLASDIQGIINEIGINSSALASSSEELSKTSVEMQKNAEQISTSESQSAASTNQSAGTIQELSASLREISKRMNELRRTANTATDEGEYGSEIIAESNKMMTQIETSSQQIEKITLIITDIAEQTNLLSLNAAIEADKAGDYGKGFAVVAEEVGELAERSNDAAQKISDLIKTNDINVQEGKEVISKTGLMLEEIIGHIRTIANQVNELVIAISEQDIGTREVAKGAEEISSKNDRNLELITQLVGLINESNKSISNISQIADQLDSHVTLYRA